MMDSEEMQKHHESMPYVDKTGTDKKPNPLRDVYHEFPRAMLALADVTAFGARKHAPRGWQSFECDYALVYHMSKVGRHILQLELEGPVNGDDGGLLHAAQAAWNLLAYLEHLLAREAMQGVLTPPVTPVGGFLHRNRTTGDGE